MTAVTENKRLWRTGRKIGRTIYMQLGTEPSDADVLIGVMASPGIAAEAVRCHNNQRQRRDAGVSAGSLDSDGD